MDSIADRLTALRARDTEFTGIAFVQVIPPPTPDPGQPCAPFKLRIHFLTDVRRLRPPFTDAFVVTPPPTEPAVLLAPADIVIHEANGDPEVPLVVVHDGSLSYQFEDATCLSFLEIEVDNPLDFRKYRLRIDDPRAGSDLKRVPSRGSIRSSTTSSKIATRARRSWKPRRSADRCVRKPGCSTTTSTTVAARRR